MATKCCKPGVHLCPLHSAARDMLNALKMWQKFWDTMPKGQMGKLVFDVGLFNDALIAMDRSVRKAEGR